MPNLRRWLGAVSAITFVVAVTGCARPEGLSADSDKLQVLTTTGLIADLVHNIGGDAVEVSSLVPDGADPHSYEPSIRRIRDVVYADVAFSNYMLLEEHSIIRAIDANLPDHAEHVGLAEGAVQYAAEIIPLVENVNLDTVWLGLRAHGSVEQYDANRSSQVLLSATDATGNGDLFGYLTGSFGQTEVYFNSADGFDAANGFRDDTARLPANAHTHMSWTFTEPGVYTVDLSAQLHVEQTSRPLSMGTGTATFVVGQDPRTAGFTDRTVIDAGHADITVNLDDRSLEVLHDPEGAGEHAQHTHALHDVVISVPPRAIAEIPADPELRFLGRPGTQIYQLPQAVLGKHVHGEIDPHLWQNVRNTMSYVELIRDELIALDPANTAMYREQADRYLGELEVTDQYVRDTLAAIEPEHRHLITTHDSFGYLAAAYDLEIAGFIAPNPAIEPSLADRRKLVQSIRDLQVNAVFLEPYVSAQSTALQEIANEQGMLMCDIYSDSFDSEVTDYISMMRFNADSIYSCLTDTT